MLWVRYLPTQGEGGDFLSAKTDTWAAAASIREETEGWEVVQNELQWARGFWGRTINSLTIAAGFVWISNVLSLSLKAPG